MYVLQFTIMVVQAVPHLRAHLVHEVAHRALEAVHLVQRAARHLEDLVLPAGRLEVVLPLLRAGILVQRVVDPAAPAA